MNKNALSQLGSFYGTEHYYRHLGSLVYTDGVKHLCDNAGAFWLLDIIVSYQGIAQRDESLQGMQFWSLKPWPKQPEFAPMTVGAVAKAAGKIAPVQPAIPTIGGILHRETPTESKNFAAYVVCNRDENDAAIVQDILYTDFPFDALPEAKIWVAPTEGPNGKPIMVAMLPSEY